MPRPRQPKPPATQTVNEAIVNEFLEYGRRELGLRPQTLYRYSCSYRSFLKEIGDTPLASVSADQMREWIHAPKLVTGQGNRGKIGDTVAPATVKRRTCELRSLFGWLADIKEVTRSSQARKLKIPTVHNEEPKPAPEHLWRQLWAADMDRSDRVAFGLAFFCGLRRHEITQLGAHNFVEVPEPRISNFERKGGKWMSLPYVDCVGFFAQRRPDLLAGSPQDFLSELRQLCVDRAGEPVLLPWQTGGARRGYEVPDRFVDPGVFNRRLRLTLAAAGMDELSFSPHQLRHSFGTNMLRMGMSLLEVSRLMGHSSVSVTQRYVATLENPFTAKLESWQPTSEKLAMASPWT